MFSDFEEYIHHGEPSQRERAWNWSTAIGLQAVDGLTTSDYLRATAQQNIEGDIELEEVQHLIRTYYQTKIARTPETEATEEADKVAANIALLLSQPTLDFTPKGYVAVHRNLFAGVLKIAGHIRDYNITKSEWVLQGDTVSYLGFQDIRAALEYDIAQERAFDYAHCQLRDVVQHLTRFVAGLWQIHAFGEGNTRTTAVFTIQYLRSIGFAVNNDLFARHSWYFRNALVRANYKHVARGINYDFIPLERFFENLLLGTTHELHNRYLRIQAPESWTTSDDTEQVPNKYRTSTEQVPNKYRTS